MSRKVRVQTHRNNRIKKKDVNKFDNPESLTLLDVQCTVCVGIFIEPVTLPCYHSVCKVCFERTIDNNSLACPLCRKYVGGWVRQNQKKGLLVNQNLWSHIRTHFLPHVEKKLRGEEDEDIDKLHLTPSPRVCAPGSIRLEYEAEQKRLRDEVSARQQQEARASEKLIEEIQKQEENERKRLEELRRKAEQEDALVAKKIAAQLNSEVTQTQSVEESNPRHPVKQDQVPSAFVPLSPQSQSSSSHQSQIKGPMDTFLNQCLVKVQRAGSTSSTDSFGTELHHFRPLDIAPKTPPKKSTGTKVDQVTIIRKPVPVMRSLDGWSQRGANTLRPWALNTKRSGDIKVSCDTPATVACLMSGEKRSSENGVMKSPKKFRTESLQENLSMCTDSSNPVSESIQSVSQKSSNSKSSVSPSESTSCNTYIDVENDEPSPITDPKVSLNTEVSKKDKPTELDIVHRQNFDIHSALLPLSLDELSEQAQAEERFRQQQADYEFAVKLQNELNAFESQNRSYELRSIVSLSPKKSQPKVTPPRSKLKSKPASSSSKKGKGRQCTLEETLNFSVKMEL